ncbi:MAG: ThiF family adenylyltransferase [Paracoccaceae bacterium]
MEFTDDELERYARHIVLREIGGPGQQKLKAARVLCIGAGGLGSPALLYLAAAGVGTLGVVDDDEVSLSNLQRQIVHTTARVGTPKTESARAMLADINPTIAFSGHCVRLGADNAENLVGAYDIVLDGSDNFDTRYAVNAACVAAGKPLVAAALSQWEGQISTYAPSLGAPCYACVFPQRPAAGLAPSCAEAGIVGALAGVVGSMMAVETVKLIVGTGAPLLGEMLIYDALYGDCRKLKLKRDPNCRACADSARNPA